MMKSLECHDSYNRQLVIAWEQFGEPFANWHAGNQRQRHISRATLPRSCSSAFSWCRCIEIATQSSDAAVKERLKVSGIPRTQLEKGAHTCHVGRQEAKALLGAR